uniref:STAS domain-containing protein n=2 Tax=Pyramimonas obovata TaxID=1411642 RepID=A0A7S0RAX6_9CHLO|mmetsp:Transcript_30/g.71  ORF Transcript_30/g.71 Transcript_30/m.71 type:complete len:706 (+) Transcript_30:211-2328(+)
MPTAATPSALQSRVATTAMHPATAIYRPALHIPTSNGVQMRSAQRTCFEGSSLNINRRTIIRGIGSSVTGRKTQRDPGGSAVRFGVRAVSGPLVEGGGADKPRQGRGWKVNNPLTKYFRKSGVSKPRRKPEPMPLSPPPPVVDVVDINKPPRTLMEVLVDKMSDADLIQMKRDILSGVTVSFAVVPECVGFALVAGVNPITALHGAAIMSFITSAIGGRPGMISGSAGAMSVCLGGLISTYGYQYLFPTCLLAGLMQIACGFSRLGKFIRLVPQPVMLGFVNGLAIAIFLSQLVAFQIPAAGGGFAWLSGPALSCMFGLVGLTMFFVQVIPLVTRSIPAPLAAIGIVTGIANSLPVDSAWGHVGALRTVGDIVSIKGSLPAFAFPMCPFTFETLQIIMPFAAAVCVVGLVDSLLAQQLVDELTETRSSTHIECIAQGIANCTCALFGSLAGCALIGQTMVNMKSGGRGRLSGITASACLMVFIVYLSPLIEAVPLAALTGVMLMVVLSTFEWSSFRIISRIPKVDTIVLLLTSVLTAKYNLAVALFTGVIASCLSFAWKTAQRVSAVRFMEEKAYEGKPAGVYVLYGPLFFGSATRFKNLLDPRKEPLDDVVLDFMECRVLDASGVEAIDNLAERYRVAKKRLHLRHLSEDCRRLLKKSGDLVEVNIMEDPWYGIATDYDSALGEATIKPWSPPDDMHHPGYGVR